MVHIDLAGQIPRSHCCIANARAMFAGTIWANTGIRAKAGSTNNICKKCLDRADSNWDIFSGFSDENHCPVFSSI